LALADLQPGEAFLIPLTEGRDPQGRREDNLRVMVSKAKARLARNFTCRKVQEGLMVIRVD
jgi:hypothetical protein